ncbi:MAG: hydantoinase/oxoprolinase family protein [Alphaproteobacteria bacterium]|nr:hydantoinase/oxoprolinase family protein [Alphaproteobacteria bacterium]
MRMSADVGGTFTDLVVESGDGRFRLFKSPTTPNDPVQGVLDVLEVAAADIGETRSELLGGCELFMHATTRATNAMLTGKVARTAFLTTEGHPDILLLREGGRIDPFDNTVPFPGPLVPRHLTFEVPERMRADGVVHKPLDEVETRKVIDRVRDEGVEAVAVCLLWSIVNPSHEERVGELLSEHLPSIPVTLSHRLNPSMREYRRASSACIDASLKPVMSEYLESLESRLRANGFGGRLLTVTSQGSVVDAADLAAAPVHSLNSGPSMAPVAGQYFARAEIAAENAIVADTGGTSYDVSLVRKGRIPWTRETWIGQRIRGHITGFPSVDVRSIGAGGGSIAWVDAGGMLHVGPQSAGSVPGPVCYGQGGTEPTVTDAALVLGYIDPELFLGGAIRLDVERAHAAMKEKIGDLLGLETSEAAAAILNVVSENMVQAIEDITINQGIDPRNATLIGGGGAAGLNSVQIARRLGCKQIIFPAAGATLSAAGALMSDLSTEFSRTTFTTSDAFDFAGVNTTLADLEEKCRAFLDGRGTGTLEQTIGFSVEGRYPHQVWEIEVPLAKGSFDGPADVDRLVADFHDLHEEMFAVADRKSHVEAVTWRAKARAALPRANGATVLEREVEGKDRWSRMAYFSDVGSVDTSVLRLQAMVPGERLDGPAIVESDFTTVVIDPSTSALRSADGNLAISLDG